MEFNVLLAAFAAKYGVEGLDGALRFLCVTFLASSVYTG